MKPTFATVLTTLTALGAMERAPAETPPQVAVLITPAFITALAEELRTNHPALQAAFARTNAAAANLDAVRTWEDPTARVGAMAAGQMMRADEGDLLYGVEQKLPLFGKPARERALAHAALQLQEAGADLLFQTLRRDLARALFQAALARRIVEIGEQDRAWLEAIVAATEARYQTGEATLAELLEARNELSRRTNQLRTDVARVTNAEFALNRLLNRAPDASWPALRLPPVAPPVPYTEQLVEFSRKFEPKTRLLQRQVEQARAAVERTRRSRWPDVAAGVEARNYTGNGNFRQGMFVLSLNLPWGNRDKYRADLRREQAHHRAAELELTDWQAETRLEIHHLTVEIDAARREALLYRDQIIPRSEQALASARAAWETGQRSLREVLEARRMLLEAHLNFARAVAEQYTRLADLVLCCGLGDFEALQMIGVEIPTASEPTNSKPSANS
ncbi:MAG: TolC family protein [Verrucomicrobiales bacterium]|nr:TolC family protein [Verrucomicrobiales bacterium]